MTLEQYLPQLRDVFVEKILPSIKGKDSLTNDKSLSLVFAKLYEAMPLAVRIIVGKDTFVSFCIKQKKSLFPNAKSLDGKATSTRKKPAVIATSKPKVAATKKKVAVTSKTAKATTPKPSVAKKVAPKQTGASKIVKKSPVTKPTAKQQSSTTRKKRA